MTFAAALLPWATALCALAAVAGGAAWLAPGRRFLSRLGVALGWAAFIVVAAAWAGRWREAGHLPLFGTWESALSLSLAVLGVALLWPRAARLPLYPAASAVAAAVLAHGAGYDDTPYALTISERSWAVDVHAVVAWAAFGALTANAGFALHLLVSRGREAGGQALSASLSTGFLLHTAMLVSGSFYKFLLFGRVWSFDPIESLGLVAWLAYGTLLHMHLLAGWQGRRLAAWCLTLFALLVISYRGIVYFPAWSTYHIFDMDLRIHVTGPVKPPGGSE